MEIADMTSQGRYRINVVAEITGVPEATLRAWERRYQVPRPSRTPSGYRVYGSHDLEQVKRMRELCESGVSPADAAREIAQMSPEQVAALGAKHAEVARPPLSLEPMRAGQAPSLHFVEWVSAEQVGPYGVLSLGAALAIMEKAAVVLGSRHTRRPVAIAGSERIDLHTPVSKGQLLEIGAQVTGASGHNVSVDVNLDVEELLTGTRRHVTRGQFTLILIDEGGAANAASRASEADAEPERDDEDDEP
jgi:DNA-binding transcriptional MerR regulator